MCSSSMRPPERHASASTFSTPWTTTPLGCRALCSKQPPAIGPDRLAFGVRREWAGSTRANPFLATTLSLYEVRGDALSLILENLVVLRSVGEWDCGHAHASSLKVSSSAPVRSFASRSFVSEGASKFEAVRIEKFKITIGHPDQGARKQRRGQSGKGDAVAAEAIGEPDALSACSSSDRRKAVW